MKQKLISLLKIILPVLVGLYLTWYFISKLTNHEKDKIVEVFFEANYFWIFIAVFIAFLSHLSRAYRWKYLLEPLGYSPRLTTMYHSVMIGYIINLTIPRSGELARAVYFSRYENAKTDKVFGTIVVERVIDLIMLGLISLFTLYLQSDQEAFKEITKSEGKETSLWIYITIAGAALTGAILIIVSKKLRAKVFEIIKGLGEGLMTIFRLKKKIAYIAHTLLIWSAYVLMFWVTALAIPEAADLNINAVFAGFIAGGIAMSATPGGIGLYPIMVSTVLIQLYGYESDVAKSFSMLMWVAQTILIVTLGIFSLLAIQKVTPKTNTIG